MNRNLAVVTAFSVALICAAAAKSTAPAHIPLPRNNPLKNAEQENQQNSTPAMALFFRKETAKPRKGLGHWLLSARVPSRRHRTSADRADLAGDAAVA